MTKNDLGDFNRNSFQDKKYEIVMPNQNHPYSAGLIKTNMMTWR